MIKMQVTQVQVLLTGFILGAIAATLIGFPMSVFAQSEEDPVVPEAVQTASSSASTTEAAVEVQPVVDPYYDNYKKEKLPVSNRVFNDFVVGPGRFSLEIAPGESKTVLLNVSNRMGSERLFRFTTEDMTSGDDETQTIRLLGDEVGPYTIKDYISVEYDKFYLGPNLRAVVPVTVSIPADAEPGGFYGSILTEAMPTDLAPEEELLAPATSMISRIGTLFYVTTPGEIQRQGALADFTTIPDKKFYFEGPVDMGITFENTGSVHLTPYGYITIENILGDVVGEVELDPWFVMPGSLRTREISWDREFLFGRYTVTAEIDRGYDNEVDIMTLSFWVIPWKFMAAVFGGLFVFFLVLRFLFRNIEIKRKT